MDGGESLVHYFQEKNGEEVKIGILDLLQPLPQPAKWRRRTGQFPFPDPQVRVSKSAAPSTLRTFHLGDL